MGYQIYFKIAGWVHVDLAVLIIFISQISDIINGF